MSDTTEAMLAQIDDAVDDWSVSMDAMRCGAPEERSPMGRLGRPVPVDVNEVLARASVQLTVQIRDAMRPVLQRVAAQMAELAATMPREPPIGELPPE